MKLIAHLQDVLADVNLRMGIIKDELQDIKKRFGDERRSPIEYSSAEFRVEDTIADEEVVITISHLGYIKRTPLAEYKVQNRGGKSSITSSIRSDDPPTRPTSSPTLSPTCCTTAYLSTRSAL